MFLQSAFTSQTLTMALHSSESVNEYPNRLERQYTLITMHNFKQTIVQSLFNQVIHRLKKTQECGCQTALSTRLSNSFYVYHSNNVLDRCLLPSGLMLGIKARHESKEFTLLGRMQMSQDLSNPT